MPDDDVYRYGDREAARLMKAAKHDPEASSAVHAARRYGPIDVSTEKWGKPGTNVARRFGYAEIPPGQTSTVRGETFFPRGEPPDVNVYRGADAPATLAHELGHVIMKRAGEPSDRDEREVAADLFARQTDLGRTLAPEARHRLRDLVVGELGKDVRRGGETDISHRPDAVHRLNRQLEHERMQEKRTIDRRAGYRCHTSTGRCEVRDPSKRRVGGQPKRRYGR